MTVAQYSPQSVTLYEMEIPVRERILATNQDLSRLRQCSRIMDENHDTMIDIRMPQLPAQRRFLVHTLQHLGISSSRITIKTTLGSCISLRVCAVAQAA